MSAARPAGPETARTDGGGLRRRPRALLILVGTALVAFGVDLGTKHLAVVELTDREPVELFGGAVYLNLTRNSGAAFSLGSDYTFVFPVITMVVIGWIGWMALRLRSLPWALSLGLVLGGALGNLADRIFRAPGVFVGHVVDMVSLFDPYGQVWPVFNVADSALVSGVVLAVVLELTGRQRDGTRLSGRNASPDTDTDAADTAAEPAGSDTDRASAIEQRGRA